MMYLTARPRGRKKGRQSQTHGERWKNKERESKMDLTFPPADSLRPRICKADGEGRERQIVGWQEPEWK